MNKETANQVRKKMEAAFEKITGLKFQIGRGSYDESNRGPSRLRLLTTRLTNRWRKSKPRRLSRHTPRFMA